MSTDSAASFQPIESLSSEYLAQVYLIKSLISRMATVTLVQVVAVTNTGTTAAVGFVDLQPLVSQVDPDMNPIRHAVIRNNPYFRMQGGKNAIILDPEVGDVGIALFASRDISAVNSMLAGGAAAVAQDPILPGSFRQYNMADALYLGGVLNGVPEQFVQFAAGGITITSPHPVTINGTNVNVNASVSATITTPRLILDCITSITATTAAFLINGALTVTGLFSFGAGMTSTGTGQSANLGSTDLTTTGSITSNGKVLATHTHNVAGVQPGLSTVASTAPN